MMFKLLSKIGGDKPFVVHGNNNKKSTRDDKCQDKHNVNIGDVVVVRPSLCRVQSDLTFNSMKSICSATTKKSRWQSESTTPDPCNVAEELQQPQRRESTRVLDVNGEGTPVQHSRFSRGPAVEQAMSIPERKGSLRSVVGSISEEFQKHKQSQIQFSQVGPIPENGVSQPKVGNGSSCSVSEGSMNGSKGKLRRRGLQRFKEMGTINRDSIAIPTRKGSLRYIADEDFTDDSPTRGESSEIDSSEPESPTRPED